MKTVFYLSVLLAPFWLALSGHYTKLLLILGIVSIALVVWISSRMNKVDNEGHPVDPLSWRIIPYVIWLTKEVVLSSLTVSKMILSPTLSLKQAVIRLPAHEMTNMQQVTYANSITLTPGTLTIDVSDDYLEVHTVHRDLLEPLVKEEMSSRIRAISNSENSAE